MFEHRDLSTRTSCGYQRSASAASRCLMKGMNHAPADESPMVGTQSVPGERDVARWRTWAVAARRPSPTQGYGS